MFSRKTFIAVRFLIRTEELTLPLLKVYDPEKADSLYTSSFLRKISREHQAICSCPDTFKLVAY